MARLSFCRISQIPLNFSHTFSNLILKYFPLNKKMSWGPIPGLEHIIQANIVGPNYTVRVLLSNGNLNLIFLVSDVKYFKTSMEEQETFSWPAVDYVMTKFVFYDKQIHVFWAFSLIPS